MFMKKQPVAINIAYGGAPRKYLRHYWMEKA